MRLALYRTFVHRAPAILFGVLLLSVWSVRPLLDIHIEKHSPGQHELFSSVNVLLAVFLPTSKQTDTSSAAANSAVTGNIEVSSQLIHVACTKNSVVDVIPLSAYLIYTQTTSSRL